MKIDVIYWYFQSSKIDILIENKNKCKTVFIINLPIESSAGCLIQNKCDPSTRAKEWVEDYPGHVHTGKVDQIQTTLQQSSQYSYWKQMIIQRNVNYIIFLLLFNFWQIIDFIKTFNSQYNTRHKRKHQNFRTKKKLVRI